MGLDDFVSLVICIIHWHIFYRILLMGWGQFYQLWSFILLNFIALLLHLSDQVTKTSNMNKFYTSHTKKICFDGLVYVLKICFCGYILQFAAMKDVSATETAIIYGLEPVWGAAFAWFLLGERWGPLGWIGAALVICKMISFLPNSPLSNTPWALISTAWIVYTLSIDFKIIEAGFDL